MKTRSVPNVTRARVFVEADPDTKKIYSVQVLINTSAGEHEITYDTSKMSRKKALEFLEKTSAVTLAFYDCFKAAQFPSRYTFVPSPKINSAIINT